MYTGGPSLSRASVCRFLHYVEFFSKPLCKFRYRYACYFGFTISSFPYLELIGLQKWNRDNEGPPVISTTSNDVSVLVLTRRRVVSFANKQLEMRSIESVLAKETTMGSVRTYLN